MFWHKQHGRVWIFGKKSSGILIISKEIPSLAHEGVQCNWDWEEKKEDFTVPKTKGGLRWVSSLSTRVIGSSPPASKESLANFKVHDNEFLKEKTIMKALEKSTDFCKSFSFLHENIEWKWLITI